ncbi:MAG: hypothetical protein WC656_01440 [Sulfurimonas sp.]
MTTTQLEEIKFSLILNGYLPNSIDMYTRLNIIDAKASNYQYWGHKNTDGNENYQNSAVAIKFAHSMVKKSFWIVLFSGAQYRHADIQFVGAYWELPQLDDAIYAENGVKGIDKQDGVETILDIVTKFDYLWFTEDEASEYEPITHDNSNAVEDLAIRILNILNLNISLSVPLESINETHIEKLENALEVAKRALGKKADCDDEFERIINAKHLFNIGEKVKILKDEIDSSNDKDFLESLLGQVLTITDMKVINEDLVHYTCTDKNGNVIIFRDNIPFAFIDADLVHAFNLKNFIEDENCSNFGHIVSIYGLDINKCTSIAFEEAIENITQSILNGDDAGSGCLDDEEYEWEIDNEESEELENLAFENKAMAEFLEKLGFIQDDISAICSSGVSVQPANLSLNGNIIKELLSSDIVGACADLINTNQVDTVAEAVVERLGA